MKKAQVSIELLAIISFILTIFIPIIFYSYTKSAEFKQASTDMYASLIANNLASLVSSVYYSGEGSLVKTTLNIPVGVKNITYNPKESTSEIVVTLDDGSQIVSIAEGQIAKDSDLLGKGVYRITITYEDDGILIKKE